MRRSVDSRARRPVPPAARGVRPARPLRARQALVTGRTPPIPAGPADQRRRGAGAGRGLLRGAARPQGPHAGRHARPAPRPTDSIDTEPATSRSPGATWRPTRSAARSRSRTPASERAILSLIGPASVAVAGAPSPRRTAARPTTVRGVDCLVVGTEDGIDLIVPAAEAARLRDGAARRRRRRGRRRGGRDRPHRGGRPRFGAEMSTETMPAEAGIVEAAVSFTKGCYIGQEPVAASITAAARTATCAASASTPGQARRPPCASARRRSARWAASASPRPRPDRAGDRPPRGRAGAELAVGEDGVMAQVVDLPFG